MAARALLEEEGEEALTMRSLAERLGIKAPSLYKHVSSRREIETLLAAEALNEMRESLAAADGLEEMGRSYRAWAIANPSLYRIATTRPLDRENLPTGLEDAAAAPLLAAVDGDRARARAFWALDNPALYRVATTRPLDRENLTPGLEDAAAAPLLEALDGDRNRARAFWALAHGLVLLELDGRFPGDADLEAAWLAGIS